MEPEPEAPEEFFVPTAPREPIPRAPVGGIWTSGGRIAWIAGLVLMLSSFMDWYASPAVGNCPGCPTTAIIGWHTGALGKLIFFLGLALIVLAVLREFGVELPPSVPESLIVIAIGAISTIFVLIRLISIPDEFFGAGRGIGIWIALIAALAVIFAGLLRAGEEL
jgi:hypothetical protein